MASDVSFLSSEYGGGEGHPQGGEDTSAAAGGGSGSRGCSPAISTDYSETIEKLSEKRTSTREAGLKDLIAGLRSYAYVDLTVADRESIFTVILNLLKRANESEGVLCAEALCLMLLFIGPSEDEIFGQVVPPLEFIITRSRYEDVRIEVT